MWETSLLYGLLIGAGVFVLRLGGIVSHGPTWVHKWFRPRAPQGDTRSLVRLEAALSEGSWTYLRFIFKPFWIPAAVVFGMTLLGSSIVDSGYLQGSLLSFAGLSVFWGVTGRFNRYRLKVVEYAALEVARRLHPDVATRYLVALASQPWVGARMASVAALRLTGTPGAIAKLEQLKQDDDKDVSAMAHAAHHDLKLVWAGELDHIPVERMTELAKGQTLLLPKMSKNKYSKEHAVERRWLEESMTAMDNLLFSQLPLRHAFPHVICKKCLMRAEKMAYESWDWLRCSRCKQADGLVPGVVRVIGQIGADVPWAIEEGELRVSLWDDATRTARVADLSGLEIVGGKDINYDWAVSAVLGQLHNQGILADRHLDILLRDAPVLEANTLQLLQSLDGKLVLRAGG
jgi:hypothetical protein